MDDNGDDVDIVVKKIIRYPKYPMENPNMKCWATGWGTTKFGGSSAKKLQEVQVLLVSQSVCNNNYGGDIDATTLCAGETGKDACQGDSGGPLVCEFNNGKWYLEGVTSWGIGCGQKDYPGVYARVGRFRDWVLNNIGSEPGTQPPATTRPPQSGK